MHHNHTSPKQRAFDKRMASAMRTAKAEKAHQMHKMLAELGKRQAKTDLRACRKARRNTKRWPVNRRKVKLSPIDWL